MEEQKNFKDDFKDDEKVESSFFSFIKPNDFIIGYLKEIEDGQYGEQFVLDTENGDIRVGGFTALKSKINNKMLAKKIKIVFLGEKKAEKGGRMYKDFEVFVK